jgi:hypothetical protein
MEIKLPTEIVKAETENPTNLIIFSKPKVGKTTLLAALPNCLILDLEKGSKYVDALKIQANSVEEIFAIGKEIKKANRPYTFIAVDTITALEEMCVHYAEILYDRTPLGKDWFAKDPQGNITGPGKRKKEMHSILNLPNGAGYKWLRDAFSDVINHIKTWADHIILVGHVKDVNLEKNGSDFSTMDLDLTGKLKSSAAFKSDAIGYLYRKGNQNILSFKTSDQIACGARPAHLKNAEVVVSEMDKNGNMIFHWDKVYININSDKK